MIFGILRQMSIMQGILNGVLFVLVIKNGKLCAVTEI